MIVLDYRESRPIYEQIADKFEHLILTGVLQMDTQMPSVRTMAMELSINPNTIQKAYERLEREGFIYTVKGRGNYVAGTEQLLIKKREDLENRLLALKKEALEYGMTVEELILKLKKGEA